MSSEEAQSVIAGQNVSRETIEKLRQLQSLVEKWTPRINLVSKASLTDIWSRHIIDSVQLFPLVAAKFDHWADLGSGGGFPGLVIAILSHEHNAAAKVTLIESDVRKATFLRNAARELAVSVTVIDERIEAITSLNADILSARALGSLDDLLHHASRHLAPDGTAIFPKGRTVQDEIAVSRRSWRFDLTETGSITDPDATILRIERIERV